MVSAEMGSSSSTISRPLKENIIPRSLFDSRSALTCRGSVAWACE